MTRLVWTDTARAELAEVFEYIAERNPHAARRTASLVEAAAALVARRNIGRIGRRRGTFEKSVIGTRYILIYIRDETTSVTQILNVRHTSRDWS